MDREAEKRYLISERRALTDGGTISVCEYSLTFERLPREFEGLRLLHLTDLHAKSFGQGNKGLVRACAAERPDIIFFTGDIFSRDEEISAIERKLPMMRALDDIAPLCCVFGNHEVDAPKNAERFAELLRDIGVTVLRNERRRLLRGRGHIDLCGLELATGFYRSPKGHYLGLEKVTPQVMNRSLGTADEDSFTLLLAHTPLPFEQYAEWGADLTLSGHIHGGMVRLGGIGLLSPERVLFPRYSKGIYTRETSRGRAVLALSAGLGKFRVNDPPMISVIVIHRKEY